MMHDNLICFCFSFVAVDIDQCLKFTWHYCDTTSCIVIDGGESELSYALICFLFLFEEMIFLYFCD